MVACARKRWMLPSSIQSAVTPRHTPFSMMRSSAKYSMKNSRCNSAIAHKACAALRARCYLPRKVRWAGAFAQMCSSCRQTGADRFCLPRCAKTERQNVRVHIRHRRMAAHIFNGVLVAQPVRTFHCVVNVPAPVIVTHVRKRSRNAALCRNGMRARRKNFRDARRFQSRLRSAERCAKPRATCAYDNDIKGYDRLWDRNSSQPSGTKNYFENCIKCRPRQQPQ